LFKVVYPLRSQLDEKPREKKDEDDEEMENETDTVPDIN